MDIMNTLTFILVAALLVISPGPNGVLIAKTVPVSGRKAGYACIGGFVAAFYVHGTLSVLGISVLLVQSAQAFIVFKLMGAAYLCWIGLRSLLAAWKNEPGRLAEADESRQSIVSIRGAFLEGFMTNALNPKVSMFYLAAFPQFLSAGDHSLQAYGLVTLHALINVLWFSAMVLMLSRLGGLAGSHRFIRWLKSFTGAVFIGFGAKLALLKP